MAARYADGCGLGAPSFRVERGEEVDDGDFSDDMSGAGLELVNPAAVAYGGPVRSSQGVKRGAAMSTPARVDSASNTLKTKRARGKEGTGMRANAGAAGSHFVESFEGLLPKVLAPHGATLFFLIPAGLKSVGDRDSIQCRVSIGCNQLMTLPGPWRSATRST
jgi:hypothetical protein